MQSLKVFRAVSYLTETDGITWRTADYDAWRIVRATKGDQVKGWSKFKINGVWKRYDEHNFNDFIGILINTMGKRLRKEIEGRVSIVPIPNSGMTFGAGDNFRAIQLANRLANGFGVDAACEPVLRWAKPMTKVHVEGGFRHPDRFEPHLRLQGRPKNKVILFDDVLTTGSQMTAAARFLAGVDFTPHLGVVESVATKLQDPDVLKWKSLELHVSRDALELDDWSDF